jgi:hypothetical protein
MLNACEHVLAPSRCATARARTSPSRNPALR